MSQILDYAWARPPIDEIKTKGYVGVMRYLAPLPNGKVIDLAEYKNLLSAGLLVGLNWESYSNRAREGAAAGTADAKEALRQANLLGYAGVIYFSVDYDAPESDQPALNAYFMAVSGVIGLQRTGAYGGYWVVKRLFDSNHIRYGWQTTAWSGGKREQRCHLYQIGKTDFNGQADIDEILKPDWRGPVTDYRAEQAKDVWSAESGIHDAWLAHYEQGIVLGPPVGGEIKTVDWNGSPIVRQDFTQGWIEYYVQAETGHPAGSNHGYTLSGKSIVSLW